MLSTHKPKIERGLAPFVHVLRHVDPNAISLLGLLFPVLFFICIVNGWYWWGLLVFVFNGVDMLDGMVARAQNKVTAFGGFLDSTIDRFADFTVLVAFGFAEIVPWEVVLLLVLLTYLISYIRSRTELAAAGQLKADVGLVERTERLVMVFAGLLLYVLFPSAHWLNQNLLVWVFGLMITLSAVTVWQRVAFAYRKLQSF